MTNPKKGKSRRQPVRGAKPVSTGSPDINSGTARKSLALSPARIGGLPRGERDEHDPNWAIISH